MSLEERVKRLAELVLESENLHDYNVLSLLAEAAERLGEHRAARLLNGIHPHTRLGIENLRLEHRGTAWDSESRLAIRKKQFDLPCPVPLGHIPPEMADAVLEAAELFPDLLEKHRYKALLET